MTDTSHGAADVGRPTGTGRPSRRSLIGWGGAGLVLGAGAAGGTAMTLAGGPEPAEEAGAAVPFHGEHQAGIATAVPDRLHFAAFDVTTRDRAALVQLLKDWTAAAARMTQGHAVGDGAFGACRKRPRTTRAKPWASSRPVSP